MFINIDGLQVNYEASGQGQEVILLHGWGGDIRSFEPVYRYLARFFHVYSIDLPGFGASDPPPEPWGVEEYAALVSRFIDQMEIKHPIIIGHSFGGRIAIVLGAKRLVHKLVLVDSAGIKPRRGLNYYLKVYTFKIAKGFVLLPVWGARSQELLVRLKKRFGSADYREVSGVMQQTLVKVINEDLRHLLPKIKAPTLLIWGENDKATPVEDGQLMEKLIPDAGLVVLKNAGHFSYLERLNDFLTIISSFLGPDRERNHE